MRVLVTGAAGFVGLNLLAELDAAGHTVVGLSRSRPELASGWDHPELRIVPCDVRDAGALAGHIAAWHPTHIIHAAAITPSREQERADARLILETNQLSTLTVLTAAAERGVTRVLFVSSAGVYAPPPDATPLTEDGRLRHDGGLYGLTKIAAEGLCRWARTQLQLDARAVRVGPVYGPYERPTPSRRNMSLVCQAVALALAGEPLRCNDPDATYDWVYARDAARGMCALLETSELPDDVYNLAGPPVPMRELLATVGVNAGDTTVEWTTHEDANLPVSHGVRRAPLATARLERDAGYQPLFTLGDGIGAYVAWLRASTRGEGSTGWG